MAGCFRILAISIMCLFTSTAGAQEKEQEKPSVQPSAVHVYIDYEFIWTVEVVNSTPVVNIITFGEGEWPLKPNQIRIYNQEGKRAQVEKFSMETGAEPYITPSFRVLGSSFIAIDLIGNFEGFAEPTRVVIDLGRYRYELAPIGSLEFETLAQQINKINFDSPDVKEDYAILHIDHMGKRRLRPRRN